MIYLFGINTRVCLKMFLFMGAKNFKPFFLGLRIVMS